MKPFARYYIAQLTPDLFRREPTNVGVIVLKDGDAAARFIGERTVGEIDKRQLGTIGAPNVFVQWVEYWRRLIRKPSLSEKDLFDANGGNFNVVVGGEVSDIANDPAQKVLEYLYPLIVSDGGLIEALGKREAAEGLTETSFKKKISQAFDSVSILEVGSVQNVWTPPHPVRKEHPVKGKVATHTPAYSQENGKLTVMETIDFNTRYKILAKDHAGFAAFIFRDIKEAKEGTEAVAIIQLASADRDNPTVAYSLSMLEKTADRIVNWSMMPERDKFITKCVENAMGPPQP